MICVDHKDESPAREVTGTQRGLQGKQNNAANRQAQLPLLPPQGLRQLKRWSTQQGEWLKDRHAGITTE